MLQTPSSTLDKSLHRLYEWAMAHGLNALFVKLKDDKAVAMDDLHEVLDETWFSYFTQYTFEFIPEEIGILTKLTRFDVRSNGLKQLPDSLGDLKQLESFTIMDNEIESIPDTITQCTKIAYFDVRENCLTHLPKEIGKLSHLEMIIARDNCLTDLPESIGRLSKLYTLDLSNNPITTLPESLKECSALETFDITGTLIQHLPEWLGEMKNLKKLLYGPSNGQLNPDWYLLAGEKSKNPPIPMVEIDNIPFKLLFEKELEETEYGAMKITFRKILDQDLSDDEILDKRLSMIGEEEWPLGNYIWGDDESGEYIEYYLSSRWGDSHGKIYKNGEYVTNLPTLWHVGPIDDEYTAIQNELESKGLI